LAQATYQSLTFSTSVSNDIENFHNPYPKLHNPCTNRIICSQSAAFNLDY